MSFDTGGLLDMSDNIHFNNRQSALETNGMQYVQRPRDPPSRDDWDRHKIIIIDKYVGLNARLTDIVHDMESSYDFKATNRMYKQRFTDWGVYKYPRAAEKRIAKTRNSRLQQSDYDTDSMAVSRASSSSISLSPPPLDIDDDEGQMPSPEVQYDATQDEICDHSDLCAHRPCIQTFLHRLERHYNTTANPLPDLQHPLFGIGSKRAGSVERVLYYVREFSQSWMTQSPDSHPHHIVDAAEKAAQITSCISGHCPHKSSPQQCERCTWAEFDFGLAMLEDGRTDLALTSFELGCRLAYLLLSSPSKLFIRNLIMALGSTRWYRFDPFRPKLLEYLALMANVVLGNEHPITIILENVACGDTLEASAESCLRIMIDIFEQSTHTAHPDVLLIKRSLSVVLRRQRDYAASEDVLLTAINDSENFNGDDCKETRRCLRRLGHLYVEQARYTEAEAVFQQILDTAPGKSAYQDNWIPDEISVYTYQHLARMASDMGDRSKCRFWFMKELDAAIKRWGVAGDYTAECLQLAYNELPPESLKAAVNQYPEIFNQTEAMNMKGIVVVISRARWCAVRTSI